ncbi:Vacuolar amino acid transporter 4 [Spathaspora sp. JA1]|nr:Vacuolar amino acid transporter 4 [Spathaspora sp. JA1]
MTLPNDRSSTPPPHRDRSTTPTVSLRSGTSNSNMPITSPSQSYDEQISNLNTVNTNVDFKTIGKHLVNPEDSLKLQGGDVARRLYHQVVNATAAGAIDENGPGKKRTRSSSFSTYLEETRRGSTASDINVPGGFRREFLINQSIRKNETPPDFLTRNFIEFLSIYGHFAGEDFTDNEDEGTEEGELSDASYEDVFDEESSLLGRERRGYGSHQIPKSKSKVVQVQPQGTASIPKTFFLVFKSLVGSGVLFLPRAFYNGGLLFSIITLTMFGIITFFCYMILIDSKNQLKLLSFGELGYKTYGKPLKICILISIIMSQIGFVATYILFTAENLLSFIKQYWTSPPPWINHANIVIIQCVFLIPLVLIRNLTKLSFVSFISSIFIIVGLLIIFWYSGLNLYLNGIGPNISNFNPTSWTMLIGVAVTSFEGIGLILPIESSMKQPEKFPMVLSISMAVITVIFVAIGTLGYVSFGEKIKSIIILNLPQNSIAVQSILILYSIAVFLTAPLQLFPAIKIGESLIFRHKRKTKPHTGASSTRSSTEEEEEEGKLYHHSGKYNPQVKWLKNLFRAISVITICTLAYINANNIDKFVSFNGCFACIPLVYIYPPLIHLKSMKAKLVSKKKTFLDWLVLVFDYLLITVGILLVVYSTYQIIFLN